MEQLVQNLQNVGLFQDNQGQGSYSNQQFSENQNNVNDSPLTGKSNPTFMVMGGDDVVDGGRSFAAPILAEERSERVS